jgi:uncharacterized protein YkwD
LRRSAYARSGLNVNARRVQARVLARIAAAAVVVATAAALAPAQVWPAAGVGTSFALASLQSGVLVQLNQIRRAHGLVPLKLSDALSAAADQHSTEMLAGGYFAHNSADGSLFWQRIARYYPSAQYRYWSVGENLLWIVGSLDATGVVDAWMASPEHRANILAPRWRDVGIAALYNTDAPGVFGGGAVLIVATDFGARG